MTLPYAIQTNDYPSFRSSITLMDAQIKALPTTPIEVVQVPGAGRIIFPISCAFVTRFSAGAYNNVSGTGYINVGWAGSTSAGHSAGAVFDSNGSILTFAGNQFFPVALGTINDGVGGVFPPGDETDGFENVNLMVAIENHGIGALTGGNAANTLKVTVIYTIFDL